MQLSMFAKTDPQGTSWQRSWGMASAGHARASFNLAIPCPRGVKLQLQTLLQGLYEPS